MNTAIKKYVFSELGNKKNAVILEIGSHYGEDTIDFLKVFASPYIYCFEPDFRNIQFLHRRFNLSNEFVEIAGGHVCLYEMALSNIDGELDFYMSYAPYPENKSIPEKYEWIGEEDYRNFRLNNSGSSSIKYGHKLVKDAEVTRVKSMRLDSWAKNSKIKEVDFIWMDAQGSEREIIEGGRETLSKTSFVWTECDEMEYDGAMDAKQTEKIFADLGFFYVIKIDNNILFRRK